MRPIVFTAAGIVFGFLLSRARATDYEAIVGMFRLTDLHIAGVMAVAIATAALGLALLRRRSRPSALGEPLRLDPAPMQPGIVAAGIVFGAGWALTGACPGTALGQVGEGKLYALFTVGGMILGTLLWGLRESQPSPPQRHGLGTR